jgi:hypothetical protein
MSIRTILPDRTIQWTLDGSLHKIDGPAYIEPDGTQLWFISGKCHRKGGPARILNDGTQEWWDNGNPHRDGGPAVIDPDGTQEWYVNGKLYREPHNGEIMPVIVKKDRISYDGKTFIPIDDSEYEKYRYHPTGRFTKSARI